MSNIEKNEKDNLDQVDVANNSADNPKDDSKEIKTFDKKKILLDIQKKKKELFLIRVKKSASDFESIRNAKYIRKDIARLFTKLNQKPS